MTRAERNEFNYIRHSLRRHVKGAEGKQSRGLAVCYTRIGYHRLMVSPQALLSKSADHL